MKKGILWIMNNPENEYGLSLRQMVWIEIMHFKVSWGLYCQEEQVHNSALDLAYYKGQCPGEANKGSGCQYCCGGHSQSRVCHHKAEPMHLCTCRQRCSTLSIDCPGEHHVTSLWVRHAWATNENLRADCIKLLNGSSKWCSILPFASGRTHRLACRGMDLQSSSLLQTSSFGTNIQHSHRWLQQFQSRAAACCTCLI